MTLLELLLFDKYIYAYLSSFTHIQLLPSLSLFYLNVKYNLPKYPILTKLFFKKQEGQVLHFAPSYINMLFDIDITDV